MKKLFYSICMLAIATPFSLNAGSCVNCQKNQTGIILMKRNQAQKEVVEPKRSCVPCETGANALTQEQVAELMIEFPDWELKEIDGIQRIERTVTFKNFVEAMSFINATADIAEKEGHHPDLYIFYNKVIIQLYTHALNGLSGNDFIIADMIDDLLDNTFLKEQEQDYSTSIGQIKARAEAFVKERDWEKFHSLKNLSMNIAVEASELMEKFIWAESRQSKSILKEDRTAIEDELSDIILGCLCFANRGDIDIATAFAEKLKKIEKNYPVEKVKGRSDKYTTYKKK